MSASNPPSKRTRAADSKPKGLSYHRQRQQTLITFTVDDPEMKAQLQKAAIADNRSLNGWIQHHIVPKIIEEMDSQLAKRQRGQWAQGRPAETNPPTR